MGVPDNEPLRYSLPSGIAHYGWHSLSCASYFASGAASRLLMTKPAITWLLGDVG